jgi:AP-1 complex subunit beta-1
LLDIDFDGAAPASAHTEPSGEMSGLEGLAGTPVRSQSPIGGIEGSTSPVGSSAIPQPSSGNNLDDLLGVFGNAGESTNGGGFGGGNDDLMNGFAGLDLGGSSGNPQSPAPKKTNDDIMSLF